MFMCDRTASEMFASQLVRVFASISKITLKPEFQLSHVEETIRVRRRVALSQLVVQHFGEPSLLFLSEESHSVYTAPHFVLADRITIYIS